MAETIDRLFLELSQVTTARTQREIELQRDLDRFNELIESIETLNHDVDDYEVFRNKISSLIMRFRQADNGRRPY